ncbi:hypothetical protein Gpo141_00006644 [Globisporangium polare]
MKRIAQLTTILSRMRPVDVELDEKLSLAAAAPKVVRETEIPRAFLLQDLREKRHFRRLARKLTAFITLLVVYGIALLTDRDISARSLIAQALSKELLENSIAPSGVTFSTGIDDSESFWDWFANSFVTTVYSTTTSSGLPRTEAQLYTIASSRYKIIGGFLIIQQRYLAINSSSTEHKGSLCYSTIEAGKNQTCFSTDGDSTESFGLSEDETSHGKLSAVEMFRYSVNSEGTGGFQTYFLRSSTHGAAEIERARLMQLYGWIDDQTRSVEIVLPTYNVHLKMTAVVKMTIEFDLTGGVQTSSYIHVQNTEQYNLSVSKNLMRFVYEIIYAALVGYFTFAELSNILLVARGNLFVYAARFGLLETVSELLSISTNMLIIVARVLIWTNPTRAKLRKAPSLDTYAPLLSLASQDDLYVGFNILNTMILTARLLKYFQVTDGGNRLLNSIVSAIPDIASFTPIYLAVIVGYTFAGHLLFGLTFPEWSTFIRAFCRVLEMNFGLYDPGPVYDASNVLGFIYLASASVVFCIIMLNVFMAIIMSTWDTFTEREIEKTKIREKYRERMSNSELVGLIFLPESTLDSLIAAVLGMDEHDTVSKPVFERQWTADHTLRLRPWVRERILRWYWNADNTPHVGPTAHNAPRSDVAGDSLASDTLHPKSIRASESGHPRDSKHSVVRVAPIQAFDT